MSYYAESLTHAIHAIHLALLRGTSVIPLITQVETAAERSGHLVKVSRVPAAGAALGSQGVLLSLSAQHHVMTTLWFLIRPPETTPPGGL